MSRCIDMHISLRYKLQLGAMGLLDGPPGSKSTAKRLLRLGEYRDNLFGGRFVRRDLLRTHTASNTTHWCARLASDGSLYFLSGSGTGTEILIHAPSSSSKGLPTIRRWVTQVDSLVWPGHIAVDVRQDLLCLVEVAGPNAARCEECSLGYDRIALTTSLGYTFGRSSAFCCSSNLPRLLPV